MRACRQGFAVTRAALTFEEATGDLTRRVELFAVLDEQRKEVAIGRARRSDNGNQYHRVTNADHNRTIRLFGHTIRFKRNSLTVQRHRYGIQYEPTRLVV